MQRKVLVVKGWYLQTNTIVRSMGLELQGTLLVMRGWAGICSFPARMKREFC